MWVKNAKGTKIIDVKTGKSVSMSKYEGYFTILAPCLFKGEMAFENLRSFRNEEDAKAFLDKLCKVFNVADYKFVESEYSAKKA